LPFSGKDSHVIHLKILKLHNPKFNRNTFGKYGQQCENPHEKFSLMGNPLNGEESNLLMKIVFYLMDMFGKFISKLLD
jgi:hypothetical protein